MEVLFLNIEDLKNKIYGYKDLGEGEYADYMIKSIEAKQIPHLKIEEFDENKQIKF